MLAHGAGTKLRRARDIAAAARRATLVSSAQDAALAALVLARSAPPASLRPTKAPCGTRSARTAAAASIRLVANPSALSALAVSTRLKMARVVALAAKHVEPAHTGLRAVVADENRRSGESLSVEAWMKRLMTNRETRQRCYSMIAALVEAGAVADVGDGHHVNAFQLATHKGTSFY